LVNGTQRGCVGVSGSQTKGEYPRGGKRTHTILGRFSDSEMGKTGQYESGGDLKTREGGFLGFKCRWRALRNDYTQCSGGRREKKAQRNDTGT